MVDVEQLSAWVVVVAAFIIAPFVLYGPNRPRHALAVQLLRLGGWLLPRLQAVSVDPDAEPGPDPAEVEAARRERLRADLRRLRRLTETDTRMSATRQHANRLAYEQLCAQVAELDELTDLSEPTPVVRPAQLVAAGPAGPVVRESIEVDWLR